MATSNLKTTVQQAGLTVEQFAEIIGVDPKTVQRWLSGRTPYPRHRATIARALDATEHQLWPDDVPPDPDSEVDGRSKPGDVTGAWGHTSDPNAPDPITLLTEADGPIDVLDDNGGLLDTPGLLDALHNHAVAGHAVRVLTTAPAAVPAALVAIDKIEVRVSRAPSAVTLVRADDRILLTVILAGPGSPPLLALQHENGNGLFDRITEHFEALWSTAVNLTDLEQFPGTQPNAHAVADTPTTAPRAQDGRAGPQPSAAQEPPRRWPRRTN